MDPKESAEETAEIDLLLFGLSHDFSSDPSNAATANESAGEGSDGNHNRTGAVAGNPSPEVKQRVAKAWSKLSFAPVPGYELDLISEFEYTHGEAPDAELVYGGGVSTHSVAPPPAKHATPDRKSVV